MPCGPVPVTVVRRASIPSAHRDLATQAHVREDAKAHGELRHCNRPTSLLENVAYIDDAQQILEWPTSQDNTLSGLVDAWLQHFSRYAIAYRSKQ